MKLLVVIMNLQVILSSCYQISRNSKGFENKDFTNFTMLQNPTAEYSSRSLLDCNTVCLEKESCLSFAFNSKTGACLLWDEDFIDISTLGKQNEDGWKYYYVVKENECLANIGFIYEPETCMCLKVTLKSLLYDGAVNACASIGASLIKIDRGLKQHKLEKILDNYRDTLFEIDGIRNTVSNIWTYSDGSEITYFNWAPTQPDGSITEIYISLRKQHGYRWHDILTRTSRAPIYQIKNP